MQVSLELNVSVDSGSFMWQVDTSFCLGPGLHAVHLLHPVLSAAQHGGTTFSRDAGITHLQREGPAS